MSSLSAEQLTALTLAQCKEIAAAHLRHHQRAGEQSVAPQFAIAVPVWWTKIQRRAMQDVR
jgi:molecular chaperone DnaK (HSP70)